MLDFLSTALTVFAVVAATALGWALIARSTHALRMIGRELATDRRFMAGAGATIVLLIGLILT